MPLSVCGKHVFDLVGHTQRRIERHAGILWDVGHKSTAGPSYVRLCLQRDAGDAEVNRCDLGSFAGIAQNR